MLYCKTYMGFVLFFFKYLVTTPALYGYRYFILDELYDTDDYHTLNIIIVVSILYKKN